MTNPKYGKIISIATAVMTVLLGIALIISAAHLFYTGGETPYTRERVEQYLSYCIIPAIIACLLIIAGKVFDFIENAKMDAKAKRTETEMLYGYAKRFDIDKLGEDARASVLNERRFRRYISIVCHSVAILFGITAVIYLAFIANFTVEELTADVLRAFCFSLPLAVLSVGAEATRIFICESSAKKERALLLDAVKDGYKPSPAKGEREASLEIKATVITRYAILGVAVLLIVIGIVNGGMADVLSKAVKICTECIGLG